MTIRLLSFMLLIQVYGFAQLQDRQPPVSTLTKSIFLPRPTFTVKKPNIDSLEKAETKNTDPRPWKFGDKTQVNISLDNSGLWTKIKGGRLWQLNIEAKDALTLNFIFGKYKLPAGAKFFIYNRIDSLGAFTEKNNQADGKFATTLMRGNSVTFEYYEPDFVEFNGEIVLSEIIYGFRDVFKMAKAFGSSGSCNNNVNCAVGSSWANQKKSVVMLVVGGSGFCTGTVVNNTSLDYKPYVLTANHCFSNDESTWVFWFNWESSTCTNPSTSPAYSSLSGSLVQATNAASDFCLVKINTPIPTSYNTYYAGWSRNSSGATSGTAIHHPSGDIKKISFFNTSLIVSSWNSSTVLNHWKVNWSNGVTEGGSSGSPLFDSNNRIVGQLHGGPSSCGASASSLNDFYGMFHISWDGAGTTATRLKNFLDPTNINPTTLDGLSPCNVGATLTPSTSLIYCPSDPAVVLTATTILGANYQWQKDGLNVGTNSPTYSANAVGNYTVIVSTAACTNTLGPVSLIPPVYSPIISPSGTIKYCPTSAGTTAPILRVTGITPPATYQWKWNGYSLPLATTDTLVVTSSGSYTLDVTKCEGIFTSPAVNVSTAPKAPPLIANNKVVCNLTTSPIPNYSMAANTQCGSSQAAATYTGNTVGYDGGNSSGANPTVTIGGLGNLSFVKISISWQKKSGGSETSCGVSHTGLDPYNDEVSFRLRSPSGTIISLLLSSTYTSSTYGGTVTTVFSDSASTYPSGYPVSGVFKPHTALNAFVEQNPNGVWTLLPSDSGSGDPLCVSGFSVTVYSAITNKWFANIGGTNLLFTGKTYTPSIFNEGLNTYYANTDCSFLCPSDPTPVNLTIDCNCANSTNLSIVGNIALTKETANNIVTLVPNVVSPTNKVSYKAGNSITLNPGFVAIPQTNGAFKAYIQGCN